MWSMFMRTFKKQKLNDAEIYYDLLILIANVEGVDIIDITETSDIPSALARLSLGLTYVMMDLDATRRERDCWEELSKSNG